MNSQDSIKRLRQEIASRDRLVNRLQAASLETELVSAHLHDQQHNLTVLSMHLTRLFDQCRKKGIDRRLIDKVTSQVEAMRHFHDSLRKLRARRAKPEKTELIDCIEGSLHYLGPLFAKNNIKVKLKIDEKSASASVPEEATRFLILGLLDNCLYALKSVDKKNKKVIISSTLNDRGLHLSVYDNGPGIPPRIVNRIWNPFFSTWKDSGGLGLYTVKGLVQQLRGQISVTSRLKGFTNFRVFIPVNKDAEK